MPNYTFEDREQDWSKFVIDSSTTIGLTLSAIPGLTRVITSIVVVLRNASGTGTVNALLVKLINGAGATIWGSMVQIPPTAYALDRLALTKLSITGVADDLITLTVDAPSPNNLVSAAITGYDTPDF